MRFVKSIKLNIAMVFVLIISMLPLIKPVEVHAEDWGTFKLMTKNSPGVTAESINAYAKKKNSDWLVIGDAIMDASNKTGINASFMIAQLVAESGWKYNSSVPKSAYNYGNMKGEGYAGSVQANGSKWAKNNNPEEGFRLYAEYIARYPNGDAPATESNPKGTKLDTIKKMLNVYAPESDNNNHSNYIGILSSIMQALGQEFNGELATGNGEGAVVPNGDGTFRELNFWIDQPSGLGTSKGVDDGNKQIDPGFALGAQVFSKKFYQFSLVVGMVLTAGLILYMSVTLVTYAMALKGRATGALFEKLSGIHDATYDKRTLGTVVVRSSAGVGVIAIFLTGLYIKAMEGIYKGVLYIWTIVFG